MTPYMDNLMEETLMLSWEPIVAEKHPSRKAVVVNPQTESLHWKLSRWLIEDHEVAVFDLAVEAGQWTL